MGRETGANKLQASDQRQHLKFEDTHTSHLPTTKRCLNCPSETLYQSSPVSFVPKITTGRDEKCERYLTVSIIPIRCRSD